MRIQQGILRDEGDLCADEGVGLPGYFSHSRVWLLLLAEIQRLGSAKELNRDYSI